MKKTTIVLLAVVLALAVVCLVSCDKSVDKDILNLDDDFLRADEYRDYAKDPCELNTVLYPEIARQGMRLVAGYSNGYGNADEVKPFDKETILENFDPNKGILVIINGINLNTGRYNNANMQNENRLPEIALRGSENEIDYFKNDPNSNQVYDMGKYWMDNGYNVLYFHWEMFADYYSNGSFFDTIGGPDAVQERVWTADSGVQAVYMRDGKAASTEPGRALNGSVAEWFASEYIAMANAINEAYPQYAAKQKDVRFAGHSMGGVLTVAASALLNLLAEDGQLDEGMAPKRLALMDSYLAISNCNYNIAWSGKKYHKFDIPANTSDEELAGMVGFGCNYLAALNMMVEKFNVAAEFVVNEGYIVPFMNLEGITDLNYSTQSHRFEGHNSVYANTVLSLCPVILVRPYFAKLGLDVMTNGHNPVREWYLSSVLYEAPKAGGTVVPTARMSNDNVRKARGQFFNMQNARTEHCETVRCDDDLFVLDNSVFKNAAGVNKYVNQIV